MRARHQTVRAAITSIVVNGDSHAEQSESPTSVLTTALPPTMHDQHHVPLDRGIAKGSETAEEDEFDLMHQLYASLAVIEETKTKQLAKDARRSTNGRQSAPPWRRAAAPPGVYACPTPLVLDQKTPVHTVEKAHELVDSATSALHIAATPSTAETMWNDPLQRQDFHYQEEDPELPAPKRRRPSQWAKWQQRREEIQQHLQLQEQAALQVQLQEQAWPSGLPLRSSWDETCAESRRRGPGARRSLRGLMRVLDVSQRRLKC